MTSFSEFTIMAWVGIVVYAKGPFVRCCLTALNGFVGVDTFCRGCKSRPGRGPGVTESQAGDGARHVPGSFVLAFCKYFPSTLNK